MPSLIWIDYCIIGLIGISGLIGLTRGLVREVFSLFAWAIAIWVAVRYGRETAAYLEGLIKLPSLRSAAAYGGLFLASLIGASVVAFVIGKLIHGSGLSGLDRLAGLLFGTARGILVVAVLLLVVGSTQLPRDPWWKQSKLIPPFQSFALWLRDQIRSDYIVRIKSTILSHREDDR